MRRYNIPFLEYRRKAFIFSLVIIAAGIVSMLLYGLNLGIDFTGGTVLHLDLREDYQMEEVREVLSPYGLEGASLQRAGAEEDGTRGTEVIVKAPHLDESTRDNMIGDFQQRWDGMTDGDVLRVDNVGAVIGEELTREAFWALAIAIAAMIGYIALRFELNFSLSGIVALFHDAFIVLAIFSFLQLEINSPFIAAVLTIIGYSINDTIVIFDRIRENLTMEEDKTVEVKDVVNNSINENLVRSINTSLTTLAVLFSLMIAFNYFIGGIDLRVFALALIIGVISGTYSSIFIASPMWLWLRSVRGGSDEDSAAAEY